jgi:uncharacterized membrane protein
MSLSCYSAMIPLIVNVRSKVLLGLEQLYPWLKLVCNLVILWDLGKRHSLITSSRHFNLLLASSRYFLIVTYQHVFGCMQGLDHVTIE